MAQLTLLRGTLAAGEGVVRLAPNHAAPGERWIASATEPHLSMVAVGRKRIALREALTHLRDWYLGHNGEEWNVLARLGPEGLLLQPVEDCEHPPFFETLRIKPGATLHYAQNGAYALLCRHGQGTVGRVAIQAPSEIHDGRLAADELFVTVEAARRGVPIQNRSAKEALQLLVVGSRPPL